MAGCRKGRGRGASSVCHWLAVIGSPLARPADGMLKIMQLGVVIGFFVIKSRDIVNLVGSLRPTSMYEDRAEWPWMERV